MIKEIIIRSPGKLKLRLLQIDDKTDTWASFIKQAEDLAWVAFPEMIVNEIEDRDGNEFVDKEPEVDEIHASKGTKLFCHIHGESNHRTAECKIVKLLESKCLVKVWRSQTDEE